MNSGDIKLKSMFHENAYFALRTDVIDVYWWWQLRLCDKDAFEN